MRLPGFSVPLCLEGNNYGHRPLVCLPCLFPLRCVELFVAVAAVSVAELFAAVAAGDTVAVLPFGPLFHRAAVAVPEWFAAAAAGDTVVVLLFSS